MKKNILRKNLVMGIVFLLIGVSAVSSTGKYIENLSSEQEQLEAVENSISPCNEVFEAYAYAAYFPGGQEGLHGFDLNNPGNLTFITSGCSFFLSGACFVPPYYIYGTEYSTGIVWVFNILTLELYVVGGGGMGLNGLDYDDESGFLYAVVLDGLYKINITTGEQTYIGGWTTYHMWSGIAINNGICYGHDVLNDAIYIINLDTAELTLLGYTSLDCNYAQDMAFDKDNDTLYLATYTTIGQLYICNTTNCDLTLVGDFEGGAQITGFAIPYYDYNQPPGAPTIDGPDSGEPGIEYEYIFNSTDPDGDSVMYFIDWGDNNTEWTEFGDSGEEIILKHTWDKGGEYTIKAKAKDTSDAESNWTYFEVEIPRTRTTSNTILLQLLERFPNAFLIIRQILGL